MSDSSQLHGLLHSKLTCPSPSLRGCSNSCPLNWWCHPTISSSAILFSCLQSFPASKSFPKSWLFTSHGQSIGVSASASVFPMSIQGWFSLGLIGFFSFLSKGLSRVFSNTQFKTINSSMICFLYGPALTFIHDCWKDYCLDYTDLCWQSDVFAFNILSSFVIAFLPRINHLLISWLHSPSAVNLEPRKRKSRTASTLSPSICYEVMGLYAMIFSVSRLVVSNSLWPHRLYPIRLLCPWSSPGKNTGVGCYFLLHSWSWSF